jgi:hypothetical protein
MTDPRRAERLDELGEQALELLRGSVDLHVHAAPDPFQERKMDARETVAAARKAGQTALVLKSHEYPTQPLAWALNSEFDGIEVYGALALDHAVGGLNPDALETALRIGTRVVWWPTFDSVWSRETFGRWNSSAPPMTVLDEAGDLLPVCHGLLDLMVEHDALLCSGHLSPAETLALVRESRRRGLRSLVTHATSFGIPLGVQQELAGLGAYMEQCGNALFRPDGEGATASAAMRSDVRALGGEHVVLSTDLGQATNPPAAVGFGLWIEQFLEDGFSENEVQRMVQVNPAELLA